MVRELHLHGVVITAVGPGVAEFGPVVRILLLAAVLVEALLEQAELIPQTVAGQGHIGAGGAVQEAGSKTAKTAVAQSGILDVLQNGQVHAPLSEQLLHFVQNAQVVQVAVHQTADQVLGRKIVGLPLVHPGPLAAVPVVGNGHHDGVAQGLVQFLRSGLLQGHVVGVLELCFRPLENIQTVITHIQSPIYTAPALPAGFLAGPSKNGGVGAWIVYPYPCPAKRRNGAFGQTPRKY